MELWISKGRTVPLDELIKILTLPCLRVIRAKRYFFIEIDSVGPLAVRGSSLRRVIWSDGVRPLASFTALSNHSFNSYYAPLHHISILSIVE